MKNISKDFLVGCLVLLVVGLLLLFGWLMGVVGPFHQEVTYEVVYNFAGGVEVGSPVRVAGVKVGKVKKISFLAPDAPAVTKNPNDPVTIAVTIAVSKSAAKTVREDSKFYINMAGIIGERYVEISPGGSSSPVLAAASTIRGIDPPRIDQLLSQGYGVFGKIQDFLEQNQSTVTEFLSEINRVMKDATQLLKVQDRKKLISLVENLSALAVETKELAVALRNPEAKKMFDEIRTIIDRAHEIDKPTLKKFLQEEGVRARIF